MKNVVKRRAKSSSSLSPPEPNDSILTFRRRPPRLVFCMKNVVKRTAKLSSSPSPEPIDSILTFRRRPPGLVYVASHSQLEKFH